MRKFHLGAKLRKFSKSALCAALAVAMVVPVSVFQLPALTSEETAEAADAAPTPIMTVDFDKGIKGEAENGNEASIKQYDHILQFEELKDASGNYMKDAEGNYRYELTDTPFIEGTDYKYGTDGNQPTSYWDSEFGEVLMLNATKKYKTFYKTEDAGDQAIDAKYPNYTGGFPETEATPDPKNGAPGSDQIYIQGNPVSTPDPTSLLQEKTTTHSAMYIKNPFAGMDLSETPTMTDEGPQWTKGVSISYWVKAPVYELTQEQKDDYVLKNDSWIITFQNDSEKEVYDVDDIMKYEACQGYDATVTNGQAEYIGEYSGDKYTADMYSLGDLTEMTDPKTNNTYKVRSNYGVLIRFNKDFEGNLKTNTKIYFQDPTKTSTGDVEFTDAEGNAVKLYDLEYQLYDQFHTLDIDQGSMVRRGKINGSLNIAASTSFNFKEDDYRTENFAAPGEEQRLVAVEGATQDNPNADHYGELVQFRHYNTMYYQAMGQDGYGENPVLTPGDDGDTDWHYVTCVIMNDWVDFYVDGELFDCTDGMYSPSAGLDFSKQCASKYFNKGWGLRGVYTLGASNVSAWIKDGTAKQSPANKISRTMLDWISDPETKLMLGGQGSASEGLDGHDIGNADGTLLDDVTFYDTPLTEDEAVALYEQAVADKEAEASKAPELLTKFDFTADTNHKMPEGMSAAETNTNASLGTPEVVNDATRGHVLKLYDNKSSATTGTVLATNPFAGKDLTGATISYWYRGVAKKGAVSTSIGPSFNDEPKVLVHNKIQPAVKDTATRTGLWLKSNLDAEFSAGYDTKVYESLKNDFHFSTNPGVFYQESDPNTYKPEYKQMRDEWINRGNSFSKWHYITAVFTDAGIQMYYDGEKLSNNKRDNQDRIATYGPRFFDGYYQRVYDGFSAYRLSSNDQAATSLMSFLTQADTKAYIGVVYASGSTTSFQRTYQGYYDDISYYAGAMTDAQVAEAYKAASEEKVSAVPGEDIEPEGDEPVDPGNTEGPQATETAVPVTPDPSGNFTAEANGVTVSGKASSIPEGAELVVAILGETDAAADYTAADAVLNGISGLSIGKRVLYDIYFQKDGARVQPSEAVTVTITPPSGYNAAQISLVSIDNKSVVSSSVSGGKLVFSTASLGRFALVEAKAGEAPSGNQGDKNPISGNTNKTSNNTSKKSTTSGSTSASKTADAANVVLPLMLLAAAFAALVVARKRKIME